LLYEEEKEIEEILKRCSSLIKDKAESLLAEVETCAILDALFAKAIWGLQHEACVAELVDEGLVLVKAKHPLIDKDKVVANTYRLEPPYRMLLITGPNTGGKTVSLKVIALSVIMTYCGMPIICEDAKIPYFDQVFIDIGDDQSVQESLSTFSAHLSKLAKVSNFANTNSLVLLDEIGSGTDPKEGEALAIAMLDELRNQKIMTVATTHYNRLKNYGKRHDDILLASVQFDVDKLIPTYKYIEGLTGQSNAFAIARRYGLSDKVIKHAEFLRRQSKTQEEVLIEKLEQQLLENQELKEQLAQQKSALETQLKEVEAKQRRLDHDLEVSRDKAEAEAEKYLAEVRKEADELMDLMRHADSSVKMHELIDLKKQLDVMGEKGEENLPVVHKEFEVGDTVELKNSHQLGVIKVIEKNQIHVEVNGIIVKTKAKQLLPSEKRIVKKKQVVSVRNNSLPTSFPLECNLIGMRVEEAMEVMEKYLDNAKVVGIKSVRIIHGDGSGALRKACHERLRKDKQVDSFRLGMPNEGSTGATVVVFKG
ncbi:MAG: Smr/MutS family protein, partial [Erysipelotrichaceae bacterium]|nr:Smr/MutS family protein [Erysipelotrichaceae bacterium]